jgi:hypothetical protein
MRVLFEEKSRPGASKATAEAKEDLPRVENFDFYEDDFYEDSSEGSLLGSFFKNQRPQTIRKGQAEFIVD